MFKVNSKDINDFNDAIFVFIVNLKDILQLFLKRYFTTFFSAYCYFEQFVAC